MVNSHMLDNSHAGSIEYQKHRKMTEFVGRQRQAHHETTDNAHAQPDSSRFGAAQHHVQSVQPVSEGAQIKGKYDLPMSSYHPVIS
jgi:hypothetical protein